MTDPANFQQRIFAAFPPYPQFITIFSLRAKFSQYDNLVILQAVRRLMRLKKVEKLVVARAHVYRLVKGARSPIDMRGRHSNVGRKPKSAHKPVPL